MRKNMNFWIRQALPLCYLWLACTAVLAVSCGDDEDDPLAIPKQEEQTPDLKRPTYSLAWNNNGPFVPNGNVLIVSPSISNCSEGCGIIQAEYFLDGVKIATVTSYPFELNYRVKDLPETEHSVKAVINIGGEGYQTTSAEADITFYAFELNIKMRVDCPEYVNEDEEITVSATPYADSTPKDAPIKEVKYYWDDELVGTATSAPYAVTFKAKGEEGSEHQLKMECIVEGKNYSSTFYEYNTINILYRNAGVTTISLIFPRSHSSIKNGETIKVKAQSYNGKDRDSSEAQEVDKVTLLWDDKVIEEHTGTPPFTFEHTINGETLGKHKLTIESSVYHNGKLVSSINSNEDVNVVE